MVDGRAGKKTILLTGATGFLGGWLVSSFLERGDRPDNGLMPLRTAHEHARLVEHPIRGSGRGDEFIRVLSVQPAGKHPQQRKTQSSHAVHHFQANGPDKPVVFPLDTAGLPRQRPGRDDESPRAS